MPGQDILHDSGSEKSTILKLVVRLCDLDEGHIDHASHTLHMDDLRRADYVLLQECTQLPLSALDTGWRRAR